MSNIFFTNIVDKSTIDKLTDGGLNEEKSTILSKGNAFDYL